MLLSNEQCLSQFDSFKAGSEKSLILKVGKHAVYNNNEWHSRILKLYFKD